MTGYEIYDEGYDAGYESAMEDLVEAAMEGNPNNREDATKAGVLWTKLRERSEELSRQQRNENDKQKAYQTNKKLNKTLKTMDDIRAKYSKQLPTPNPSHNYPLQSLNYFENGAARASSGDSITNKNSGDKTATINVRKTTKEIVNRNRLREFNSNKKANESLFDFDDIDHAYLDDGEYNDYDAANEDLFNFDDLDDYDDVMEAKNSPYRQYRKNRNISAAEAKAKIDYARDHDTEKFSGRMVKLDNRHQEYRDGMLDYAMKRPDKFKHRGDKLGYQPKSSAFRAAVDGPDNTTIPYHRQHLGR